MRMSWIDVVPYRVVSCLLEDGMELIALVGRLRLFADAKEEDVLNLWHFGFLMIR